MDLSDIHLMFHYQGATVYPTAKISLGSYCRSLLKLTTFDNVLNYTEFSYVYEPVGTDDWQPCAYTIISETLIQDRLKFRNNPPVKLIGQKDTPFHLCFAGQRDANTYGYVETFEQFLKLYRMDCAFISPIKAVEDIKPIDSGLPKRITIPRF